MKLRGQGVFLKKEFIEGDLKIFKNNWLFLKLLLPNEM